MNAALVDHRATSTYHPQADGLRERIVQVVKRALRKWCLWHPAKEWDVYLPWVPMGYNFSTQAALGVSPIISCCTGGLRWCYGWYERPWRSP
jgi:hypothetical protein